MFESLFGLVVIFRSITTIFTTGCASQGHFVFVFGDTPVCMRWSFRLPMLFEPVCLSFDFVRKGHKELEWVQKYQGVSLFHCRLTTPMFECHPCGSLQEIEYETGT